MFRLQVPLLSQWRVKSLRSVKMSSAKDSDSPIVQFYHGSEDFDGRTLEDILSWSNGQLERSHDYIQILFPVPESSPFNPWAPTLDDETVEAFAAQPELRVNMRRSAIRMFDFYGFDSNLTSPRDSEYKHPTISSVSRSATRFPGAARSWFNGHNDLRISRIIRCLRCCGLEQDAQAFYQALKNVYESGEGYPEPIRDRSFMFWTRAATRDLIVPPDMDDAQAERMLSRLRNR